MNYWELKPEGIKSIPIEYVRPKVDRHPMQVKRMEGILRKQGQIIPLQVKRLEIKGIEFYTTFLEDSEGDDVIWAARELGWRKLLVAVVDKYERGNINEE